MIQEIQLSNFKAFADTVKIPIKPITLIFGPNSAGKSSIFQAIMMLKQTLEEAESKEQMLIPKGKRVDLGNYREFIHNHDMNRSFSVTIRIPPIDLYGAFPELGGKPTVENSPEFEELCERVKALSLGLVLTFSCADKGKEIYVSQIDLLVGEDAKPLITYVNEPLQSETAGDDENEATRKKRLLTWRLYQEFPRGILKFKDCNVLHSFVQEFTAAEEPTEHTEPDEITVNSLVETIKMVPEGAEKELMKKIVLDLIKPSAFKKDDFLTLHNFLPVRLNGSHPYYSTAGDFDSDDQGNISIITLAAAYRIRECLADCMHHIGPVRHHPERYFTFSGLKSAYVGKSGEYLYDILIDDPSLVKVVNRHLANLKIGYQLKIDPLSGEDSDIKDLYSIRLVNMADVKIAMTDVGYGVSQVLPVILQCILSKDRVILIEQPELHLHPAQQAELADTFIQSSLGGHRNKILIETHSEHLILRLMRRMRETVNENLPEGMPHVSPDDVAILYVQPTPTGSVVRILELDAEGQLLDPWPGGFFEEGFRERFA